MPYRRAAVTRRRRIGALLVATDISSVTIAALGSAIAAHDLEGVTGLPFIGRGSVAVTLFVYVTWVATLAVVDSRDPRLLFSGTTYYERTLRGTFYAFALLAVGGFAFNVDAARPYVLVGLPLGAIVIIAARWLVRQWALSQVRDGGDHWLTERALVLRADDDAEGDAVLNRIPHMRSAGGLSADNVEDIVSKAISTEATVVLLRHTQDLTPEKSNQLGWRLSEENIDICVEPKVGGLIRPGRTFLVPHPMVTLLSVRTVHLTTNNRVVKRGFDLAVGSLLLVVLTPVLILGALAVFIDGDRPIFFSQRRIGIEGADFTIRKLRTMKQGAEDTPVEHPEQGLKMTKDPCDPRITRVGRFLRRWSIDEIPQLVNVLAGDMSLVGPRPRLASELTESPITSRRLRARPGLTGVWQTSGRADIPLDQADLLDVEYVDNWSILGDVVILLRTFRSVLRGVGAY